MARGGFAQAWMGPMHGPDHLYPTCPGLARVTPWSDLWPRKTIDLVDPHGGDICGWCVRVWDARHRGGTP